MQSDAVTVVREVMSRTGWGVTRIARCLGMSQQAASKRLGEVEGREPKCDFVADVLDVCGYELWAVPKGSKAPQGAIRFSGGARLGRQGGWRASGAVPMPSEPMEVWDGEE